MHDLPLSTVSLWQNWSNLWVPVSVDTLCPHCGRLVNSPLEQHLLDSHRKTVSASGRCPGCNEFADFWVVEPGDGRDSAQRGCKSLHIYPAPRVAREPIVDLNKMNAALDWKAPAIGKDTDRARFRKVQGFVQNLLGDDEIELDVSRNNPELIVERGPFGCL
jgi:hypothetical protein